MPYPVNKEPSFKVVIAGALLVWPKNLFEARTHPDYPNGTPAYTANLAIRNPGHPQLLDIWNGMIQLASKRFPDAVAQTQQGGLAPNPKFTGTWPFQHGTEIANKPSEFDNSTFKDYLLIKAKVLSTTKKVLVNKPVLKVVEGGSVMDVTEANMAGFADQFYGGVQVVAEVNFTTYTQGKTGVTCYLNWLTSLNRGDRVPQFGNASTSNAEIGQRVMQHIGQMQTGASPYAA